MKRAVLTITLKNPSFRLMVEPGIRGQSASLPETLIRFLVAGVETTLHESGRLALMILGVATASIKEAPASRWVPESLPQLH